MIEDILYPLVPVRFREDSSYREGHLRVINPLPGIRVMGLHIPDMKKVAKSLVSSGEAFSLLDAFEKADSNDLCYEEKVVWGLMIDYLKCPLEERLERISAFVPVIDNWAVCDCICGAAKWASASSLKHSFREYVQKFLDSYWTSDSEFDVRFAVIMSMSYYLDETFLTELFGKIEAIDFGKVRSLYMPPAAHAVPSASVIPLSLPGDDSGSIVCYGLSGGRAGTSLGQPPYYVRMGVAWFMATALAKYPDLTRRFAGGCSLPDDVLKLYKRKSRESFRTRDISPL